MQSCQFVQKSLSSYLKNHFEKMTSSQLSESIRQIFASSDRDDDGFLCVNEMKSAFHSMGSALDDDEIQTLLRGFDANDDGRFDLDEFETLIRESLNQPLAKADLPDSSPKDPPRTSHNLRIITPRAPAAAPLKLLARAPAPAAFHQPLDASSSFLSAGNDVPASFRRAPSAPVRPAASVAPNLSSASSSSSSSFCATDADIPSASRFSISCRPCCFPAGDFATRCESGSGKTNSELALDGEKAFADAFASHLDGFWFD
mmetsp:Transcript_75945/g.203475  ORF Transcript_75945/g.203475 Transcript_75945/m.203475 type:complete len:259 (-) Transcript_75945:1127-1903(-)